MNMHARILRTLGWMLIAAAPLAAAGCFTWPYQSGYYSRGYEPYGGATYERYDSSFDYGLYYGRPFYTTYGAYPHGYYYDPHFIGRVRRPVQPPADPPPATPPPAEPPPAAVRPTPPRDFNPPPRQVRPAQPAARRQAPQQDDRRPRQPHRLMPR